MIPFSNFGFGLLIGVLLGVAITAIILTERRQ